MVFRRDYKYIKDKIGRRRCRDIGRKVFDKMQETLIYFDHLYSSAEKCAEFKDYTIENFNKYATTVITEILNELLSSKLCPEGFLQLFIKSLYNIIVSTVHVYLINTEIIFWGYGEDDIFPSYVSLS